MDARLMQRNARDSVVPRLNRVALGAVASGRYRSPPHSPVRRSRQMNALTRVDPFDQLFPEVFRRLAWPLRVADDAPGDIRLDVTEKDKLEHGILNPTLPKREGSHGRAIEVR
jgi:hypothetical protein